MSAQIEEPALAAFPHVTVTRSAEPKYSTDGASTLTYEKANFTHDSSSVTPVSKQYADALDTDLEAMIPPGNPDNCPRKSTSCQRPDADCQVWPGQEHWKRKAKAAKVHRSPCGCVAKMTKRNRILLQVLILVLIVGIAVSIGFGISKPLGAPIPNPADSM